MGPLVMPTALAETVARRGDPALTAWAEALPTTVADLTARWDLRLGPPFEPGGTCAWVAPAQDAAGSDLVLKVAFVHDESRDEAAGLAAWGGAGAVACLRHDQGSDGGTAAMLLERARPGVELRTRPEAEQHGVVVDLLRRLHAVPLPASPPGHGFRPLAQMCAWWADEAEQHHEQASAGRFRNRLDPGLVRDGLALFRELPLTSPVPEVLLVTDLHAGNVLSGQRLPWLLVDPKPYVGDPHYDVLQHLLNCAGSLRADPVGLADTVADLGGLDRLRVRQWLFARCVQEGHAWPGLADAAVRLATAL